MGQDPDTSPALERVRKGALCAGCGLCAGLSDGRIGMQVSPEGYLRPRASGPVTPDLDATIARTCPGLVQHVEARGREDHTLWGPYMDARVGWATDPNVRFAGSSGGALSAIAIHLVRSGRVDAVIQTTADAEVPWANFPIVSTEAGDVLKAAGSRYAPSAPLADLAVYLEDGRRFAFLGKPCDVAALRALITERPEVGEVFPVLLSFYCAGVPSLRGAEKVVDALTPHRDRVTGFRYRGNGWPGRATATLEDGGTPSMTYFESWGKILSSHVQHRCKICADGTGKMADIVCADAWEVDEKGYPLFEERDGVSLVMARTALGAEIAREAEDAGTIETGDFDIRLLQKIQTGQTWRRRCLAARLAALRLVGKPVPDYRGLNILKAARYSGPVELARNFAGTLRRALQGKVRG